MATDPCGLTEGCGNIGKKEKRGRNGSHGRACGGLTVVREGSGGVEQGEGGSNGLGSTSCGHDENPETWGTV